MASGKSTAADIVTAIGDSFTFGGVTVLRALSRLILPHSSTRLVDAAVETEQDAIELEVDSYLRWLREHPTNGMTDLDQAIFMALCMAALERRWRTVEPAFLAKDRPELTQALVESLKVLEESCYIRIGWHVSEQLPGHVVIEPSPFVDFFVARHAAYARSIDTVRLEVARNEPYYFQPRAFEQKTQIPSVVAEAILQQLAYYGDIALTALTGGDSMVMCRSQKMIRWAQQMRAEGQT